MLITNALGDVQRRDSSSLQCDIWVSFISRTLEPSEAGRSLLTSHTKYLASMAASVAVWSVSQSRSLAARSLPTLYRNVEVADASVPPMLLQGMLRDVVQIPPDQRSTLAAAGSAGVILINAVENLHADFRLPDRSLGTGSDSPEETVGKSGMSSTVKAALIAAGATVAAALVALLK